MTRPRPLPTAARASLRGVARLQVEILEPRCLPSNGFALEIGQNDGSGNANIYSNAVDSSGNLYVAGSFAGTVNFNPVGAAASLTASNGGLNGFVAKYASSGSLVWVEPFAGLTTDDNNEAYGLAVDKNGYVYATGYFQGEVEFDASERSPALTSAADNSQLYGDGFVCKLNAATGAYVWAQQFGQSSGDVAGNVVAVDASQNVYVNGLFQGPSYFGAKQTDLMTSSGPGYNAFLTKLNASGTTLWDQTLAAGAADGGYGLVLDSSGNPYVSGAFSGTTNFGAGPVTSVGGPNMYVSGLSPTTGTPSWTTVFGVGGADLANGLALDSSGNLYLTGSIDGTAQFGSSNLNGGTGDAFVACVNGTSHAVAWADIASSGNADAGNDITVDSLGKIDITGYAATSASTSAVLLSQYDSAGNLIWTHQFGAGSDQGFSVATDSAGDIDTVGTFSGSASFDPTGGGGDDVDTGSQSNVNAFMSQIQVSTTTTSLTDGGPNPSTSGQAVSFTISVSPTVANGETVYLEDASNGNAVVSQQSLTNGTVTFHVSSLSIGTHHLFAVYNGDSVDTGSFSSTVTQTVNANSITVSSVNVDAGTAPVIAASESGSTVTITTDGPNGFSVGDPVVLSGISSPNGYNGTYAIATVTASTNSFTIANFPTTGLATVSNAGTATDTALTDSGLLVTGTAGSGHSASYNSQRSMVDSIVYTFNQAVTIGAGGFTIVVHSGDSDGGTAPSLSWASPNGGTTWVVTFSGAGVVGNSVANGAYDITLNSSAVSAVSGGGTLAGNETDTFFRLYGDLNGDERVNSTDYNAFNPAYNSRSTGSTAASFVAAFDVNDDGRVNSADYNAFNPDYNVRYTGFTRTI